MDGPSNAPTGDRDLEIAPAVDRNNRDLEIAPTVGRIDRDPSIAVRGLIPSWSPRMFAQVHVYGKLRAVSIGSLCIDFRLGGCRSLKEKRQRLAGLRERFGRTPNLAVFESDHHDVLYRAQWTFVAGAASAQVVEQLLAGIERDVQELVDAEVIDIRREWLG